MISGIASSLSALSVFGKQLGNGAHNVANCNTDGYKKADARITESKAGLPEVTFVHCDSLGTHMQEDGVMTETSNVDLAAELPQMMISQRGYEANLKALKAQDEVLDSVLGILA